MLNSFVIGHAAELKIVFTLHLQTIVYTYSLSFQSRFCKFSEHRNITMFPRERQSTNGQHSTTIM